MEFKCEKCDTVLSDEDIWYRNGCNEEGEDYGIVEAECPSCGMGWEESQWGEFEDLEEAKEYLILQIKKGHV